MTRHPKCFPPGGSETQGREWVPLLGRSEKTSTGVELDILGQLNLPPTTTRINRISIKCMHDFRAHRIH